MPNALLATILIVWWFLIKFLLNSYLKLVPNRLLTTLIVLRWFLIQLILKTDAKYYHGRPSPIVVASYSIVLAREEGRQRSFLYSAGSNPRETLYLFVPSPVVDRSASLYSPELLHSSH